MDLFSTTPSYETPASKASSPLAERVRPKSLDDVLGQEKLVGSGGSLRALVDARKIPSFILWGPPGCGKTTIARIVAEKSHLPFVPFSAVLAGIKDV